MLKPLDTRGNLETAKRLRATIGSVFRFAVATARAEADPTSALKGALMSPKVKHRPAITDPVAPGGLLRVIDGFSGQPVHRRSPETAPARFQPPRRTACGRVACDIFCRGRFLRISGLTENRAGQAKMTQTGPSSLNLDLLIHVGADPDRLGYGRKASF